jgi:hypothetical protein
MKRAGHPISGSSHTNGRSSTNGYCEHAAARHIRVYLPYAEANAVRLRATQAPGSHGAHVSWLYEIPGGWGWTICRDCRLREIETA